MEKLKEIRSDFENKLIQTLKGSDPMLKIEVLNMVSDLFNQLDEPEVLSQEWIDENKELMPVNDTADYYVDYKKLQNLLVPKQEKVKVPKFVADWFENNKDNLEFKVKTAIKYPKIYDEGVTEFDRWLSNPHNKPIQTLGNMFNGYEVEE